MAFKFGSEVNDHNMVAKTGKLDMGRLDRQVKDSPKLSWRLENMSLQSNLASMGASPPCVSYGTAWS